MKREEVKNEKHRESKEERMQVRKRDENARKKRLQVKKRDYVKND